MSYAALEEVWGPDFGKKKKSRKERKLEKQEKKMLSEAVDSSIIIPQMKDRKDYKSRIPDYKSLAGYDSQSEFGSPYNRQSKTEQLIDPSILQPKQEGQILGPLNNMVQISMGEYQNLKNKVVEGFANSNPSDEQFNQLLLYIFTGIFYLMMLDMMYQLGKRSY